MSGTQKIRTPNAEFVALPKETGLTHHGIAEILGVSRITVKKAQPCRRLTQVAR